MGSLIKKPFIRINLVLAGIALMVYLPTREFLKITCLMGVPVVFLFLFLGKQIRYSITWIAAMILLLAFLGGYGYLLVKLPERIEVRRITTAGSMLIAQGKYDAAIAEYRKLEKLGKTDKMDEKVEEVEREKRADRDVELARQLVKVKDYQEARKLLENIPKTTHSYRDASKLLKSIPAK
jgi:tetratricopeptide (TPR) repeat protein